MLGKKRYQNFFSRLFDISLQGLNIGTGGRHPKDNGEIKAIQYSLSRVSEKENLVIVDAGAQIGIYTECVLNVLSKIQKTSTIYSFEPAENEYKKYVEKFSQLNNVVPYHIALSDKTGIVKLYSPENSTGLGSLYPNNKNQRSVNEVQSTTIDIFCLEKNIKRIHLLKLDVEGNELNVLKGAQKMLTGGCIDFIQFEFGQCSLYAKVSFLDLYDTLKDRYIIHRVLIDGLEEIKHPGTREECFFTTNYLAERNINL